MEGEAAVKPLSMHSAIRLAGSGREGAVADMGRLGRRLSQAGYLRRPPSSHQTRVSLGEFQVTRTSVTGFCGSLPGGHWHLFIGITVASLASLGRHDGDFELARHGICVDMFLCRLITGIRRRLAGPPGLTGAQEAGMMPCVHAKTTVTDHGCLSIGLPSLRKKPPSLSLLYSTSARTPPHKLQHGNRESS